MKNPINDMIDGIAIFHYNEIYNLLKKGENLHFGLKIGTEGYFYRYIAELNVYYRYSNNSNVKVKVSREKLISILGNYLRRVKIDKIKSKI